MQQTECPRHGAQGFGLICKHVAVAVDSGQKVGFFWGDDTDLARPDAWCYLCEQALRKLEGASSEKWFLDAEFKILCAACWDEANRVCGGALWIKSNA